MRSFMFGFLCAAAAMGNVANADDTGITLTDEDYQAAATLDTPALAALVRNARISVHWIDNTNQFWYRRDTLGGSEIVLVDVETKQKSVAYDNEKMASQLESFLGQKAAQVAAAPKYLNTSAGTLEAVFESADRLYKCQLGILACVEEKQDNHPHNWLMAPSADRAAVIKHHNLWLVDTVTNAETQITFDGDVFSGYGEIASHQRFQEVRTGRANAMPPFYTHWSPDGRWLISRRLDESKVKSYPFQEPVPLDGSFRPKSFQVRTPLLGDDHLGEVTYFIVDATDGSTKPLVLPAGFDFEELTTSNQPISWHETSAKAYLYISTSDAKVGRLVEVDMASGEIRTVLEETAESSRVNLSSSLLTDSPMRIKNNELIWYSERSGWGHLYFYDVASGAKLRDLTAGRWAVHSIVHADWQSRFLIISAMGRETGADPYQQYLYRVSLDGGDPVLLTPEKANHKIASGGVSPDGKFFIQTINWLDRPPVTVVRSIGNPTDKTELEVADASALFATGWKPPKRVKVKAADGKTELYAAVFDPNEKFVSASKRPILDANYMNSIFPITPVDFMDAAASSSAAAMARLGFFVVVVDGRGTPFRSRAFYEAGYPAFYDVQIEDHVAAIRQLAAMDSRMDLTRVGIYGHSNGGSGAARAILKRPDFYSVAVASAGSHDYMSLPPSGVKYFGNPEYADGTNIRPTPNAIPSNYTGFDNAGLAANLKGHLLLAYADMDSAALPSATLRLANALTKAGKYYDLVYMANEGHGFSSNPYFLKARRMYFMEHLCGADPTK